MKNAFVKINGFLEKYIFLLNPAFIVLGLLLGSRIAFLKPGKTWVFFLMTLCSTLTIRFSQFKKSMNLKVMIVFFLQTHFVMPLLAWAVGNLFFTEQSFVTGFILTYCVSCSISNCIWAGLFGGDKSLSIAIVIVDALVGFFLTPLTLRLFCASTVDLNEKALMIEILIMVVIPSILGITIGSLLPAEKIAGVTPYTKVVSKCCLFFMTMVSIAPVSHVLIEQASLTYVGVVLAGIFFTFFSYTACFLLGKKLFRFKDEQTISLLFAGNKNVGLSLALASSFFLPLASVPSVVALIVQGVFYTVGAKLFVPRIKKQS